MTWLRSSHCSSDHVTEQCVEVAIGTRFVVVRDSKNPDRTNLMFSTEEWAAFVLGVKDGEFDLSPAPTAGGTSAGLPDHDPSASLRRPSRERAS